MSCPSFLPGDNTLAVVSDINDDGLILARTAVNSNMVLLVPDTAPPVPKNRGDVTEDLFVGADDYVEVLSMWGSGIPSARPLFLLHRLTGKTTIGDWPWV